MSKSNWRPTKIDYVIRDMIGAVMVVMFLMVLFAIGSL